MLNKYGPLEPLNIPSKNELFTGYFQGRKVFIKKYIIREGRERDDQKKIKAELACYEAIHSLPMPKLIEANHTEQYIVLEFLDYEPVTVSETVIDETLRLHKKINSINIPVLSTVTFKLYTSYVFDCLDILSRHNIVNNQQQIKTLFIDHQALIESQPLIFSHGDMYFNNIVRLGDELTLIDFENAKQDNCYYDLATIYRAIYHTPYREYMYKKIAERSDFNETLFNLMLIRRCIGVLLYLKDKQNDVEFGQTVEILTQTLHGRSLI